MNAPAKAPLQVLAQVLAAEFGRAKSVVKRGKRTFAFALQLVAQRGAHGAGAFVGALGTFAFKMPI